jgi:hypothetical protein
MKNKSRSVSGHGAQEEELKMPNMPVLIKNLSSNEGAAP